MQELELLAPAKNLECGMAAVDHGADAVYIGAERFGARAAAGNSVEDIAKLCAYAHRFAVRVYVTVNTIVYDDELSAMRQLLVQLQQAGVDAVLVQDMALLRVAPHLAHHPQLRFHASTQTDNRSAEKVAWLRQLGFKRVVLARELSVDEIRHIHEQVPDMELEVFVHGALCVSYSGQCYASQHCFGRSANRGECAQFCRMRFDLVDADGKIVEHDRHLLSLKDLRQSDHLEELADAGATSFKIEGRLKDVAYVKNVTAAYSQQLDRLVAAHPDKYRRASLGRCTYAFTPDLGKTFNRGYTDYFVHGRQPNITSPDTPKATGEYVGTVKELRRDSLTVAGTARFANGDGLCFFDGQQLVGFRVNRAEANRLYPHRMPPGLTPGTPLYRNSDQEMQRLLSKATAERRIAIALSLRPIDTGFRLTAGAVSVTLEAEHVTAEKPQRDNLVRQLTKLGGTPYECTAVDLPEGFNYFIPSSRLADLRRRLVEALDADTLRQLHEGGAGHGKTTEVPLPATVGQADSYLNNIANREAAAFYGVDQPTAYELRPVAHAMIMQCRHCLRYALGHCVKHGGTPPTWREPLELRLGDGRRFPIAFDCRNCQMNVYSSR